MSSSARVLLDATATTPVVTASPDSQASLVLSAAAGAGLVVTATTEAI